MNNHTPDDRDRFEESLSDTWDSPDAAVDRRLRALVGPVTPLHAPAYGFERVALRARRRRHRTAFLTAAAGVTVAAMVGAGVVLGTHLSSSAIQTAGCDTVGRAQAAAPAAWGGIGRLVAPADPASSGVDSGREVMDRRYEWAIGGVLTAAALSVGIIAGCSGGSSSGNNPSADATETGVPTPSQSVGTVQLPATTSAPAPSGTGSPVAKVPRCHTADLSPAVSLVAGSQGAGHESLNLKLTNDSGHSCTIYGFPGMKLEDMNSSGQATTVTRNFAVKPATITLANGASAATTVRFDFDVPVADEPSTGNCEAPSVYLQITPPDETTQLSATVTGGPVTVCAHGTLDVLAFVAGSKGANQ